MKQILGEVLDQLLEDCGKPEDILGANGLLASLQKSILERIPDAELTARLGCDKHEAAGRGSGNSRNGHGTKRVLTGRGALEVTVPRDRNGSFEPQFAARRQTRLPGFDEEVVSLYSRGLTLRDIRAHLQQRCQVTVSPDLISRVTDAVSDEVRQWQSRPLDPACPVLFLDALRVRIRDEGTVRNKAVYPGPGIRMDGTKEVPGLWIQQNEGARFWLKVMNELKTRGVRDCLIAVVDGLKGFPQAIRSAFPAAQVQTCIVHLMRHALSLCSCKDRRPMARHMKEIYRAPSAEAAADRLDEFEERWGARYGAVVASWRERWEEVIPMFAFAPEIRRLMYTANAIESLNRGLRKSLKTRGHFPSDKAASKLLYLAIRNIETKWKAPVAGWRQALNQFYILFSERLQGVT